MKKTFKILGLIVALTFGSLALGQSLKAPSKTKDAQDADFTVKTGETMWRGVLNMGASVTATVNGTLVTVGSASGGTAAGTGTGVSL